MRIRVMEGSSAFVLETSVNEELKKIEKAGTEYVQDIKYAILARDQYTSRYNAMLILSEIPTS